MADRTILYVDVESMLDLRQGYLYTVAENKDALSEFLVSDGYIGRMRDEFPYGEPGGYRKAILEDDKSIRPFSTITYILGILSNRLSGLSKVDAFNGTVTEPCVWVDVHGFEFTPVELEELRDLVFYKVGSNCYVELVDIGAAKLSPLYIRASNITCAFIYDFQTWSNAHAEILLANKLPDSQLYFPPLGKEVLTREELSAIEKTGFKDVFNYLEMLYSSVAKVNFLPCVFYSNAVTAKTIIEEYSRELKSKMKEDSEKIKIPDEIMSQVDEVFKAEG